ATSNYLADLAARIKAEHEAATAFIKQSLERAIRAGELLIEAKAKLKHGQWLPWLREHCRMSERTGSHYMRLARHAAEFGNVADLTVRGALELLSPPSNEGEAILRRLQEADCQLAEAVEDKVERQRVFVEWLFAQSPSDQRAFLETLSPNERRPL